MSTQNMQKKWIKRIDCYRLQKQSISLYLHAFLMSPACKKHDKRINFKSADEHIETKNYL